MKRTLCLILLAQVFVLVVDARAQTLADAARSERARQSAVASRTFTNDDVASISPGESLASTPAASAPTPGPQRETTAEPAQEQEAGPAKPTGPVDKQGRDEKYWRGAFETARADLKRAEDRALVLEIQRNEINLQILRQSNLYNRENVLRTQLNTLETELATVRKTVEAARLKISDLEEELRRSGGHPGWAR
jgi:hypothetical protein